MRKKRPALICFVGMDGTGKTTQAKRLAAALQARGIRSQYVWNTYKPFLTRPLIALGGGLFLRGKNPFQNYAQYSQTRKGLLRSLLVSRAYEYFSLLDYLCQTFVKVGLPLMRGKAVVCDRYAHDVVVGLAMDLGYGPGRVRRLLDNLLRLLPRPQRLFLLDVSEEVGYRRKRDVPSVDYLVERRAVYLELAKAYKLTVIDASASCEQVESWVRDSLKEVIN